MFGDHTKCNTETSIDEEEESPEEEEKTGENTFTTTTYDATYTLRRNEDILVI